MTKRRTRIDLAKIICVRSMLLVSIEIINPAALLFIYFVLVLFRVIHTSLSNKCTVYNTDCVQFLLYFLTSMKKKKKINGDEITHQGSSSITV